MRPLARVGTTLSVFAALSASTASATDGYFDAAWIGGGRTTFRADPVNSAVWGYDNQLVVESNGNLLLGGLLLSSPAVSWWMSELLPDGSFNNAFPHSRGRILRCGLSRRAHPRRQREAGYIVRHQRLRLRILRVGLDVEPGRRGRVRRERPALHRRLEHRRRDRSSRHQPSRL